MPKPSFGCMTCRARKVKCDEGRPSCRNCRRKGLQCGGYQETFDVLHRQHIPITAHPSSSEAVAQPQTGAMPLDTGSLTAGLPAADADSFALGVYYANYCVEGSSRWSLDDLRQQGNGCMFAAVKTMGYQAMNPRWGVNSTLLLQQHHHAIQLLNAALASESERTKDSTLMATILMGAIETTACSGRSVQPWQAHTQGAAALLRLRGAAQVTSPLGSSMFFQVTFQIFTSSLLGKCAVPASFVELSKDLQQYVVDNECPLWRWHWAMIRFIDFMAETSAVLLVDDDERTRYLRRALDVYDEIVRVFQDAPSPWQYTLVSCVEFPAFTEQAAIYNSITVAQMWNGRRIATNQLWSAIRLFATEVGDVDLVVRAETELSQAAEECIRASPQVLGVIKARLRLDGALPLVCQDVTATTSTVFSHQRPDREKLPMLQACLLQWSIYFTAQSEVLGKDVLDRLWRILDHVGESMHVMQWKILANRLIGKEGV